MFLDEMVDLLKGQVDLHDKNSKKDTLECPLLSVCHSLLVIRFIYIFSFHGSLEQDWLTLLRKKLYYNDIR